jgi:hypothetical protein
MMGRVVAISAVILHLMMTVATAGQSSAGFKVGLTIGGAARASVPSTTYTWGAAAISVAEAGFDNLQRAEKTNSLYWFTGDRDGSSFRIAVSITSGAVIEVIPV